MIPPITVQGKPAKYAWGHNPSPTVFKTGHIPWTAGKKCPAIGLVHKGKKISKEEIEQRTKTRLKNNNGIYQVKRGWKQSEETKKKISDSLKGEKNHGWKGGISKLPYGFEFNDELKHVIRDRDGNICQRCGKTPEQNKKTLAVHHIDHDKMNNDPRNLVTVCNVCNIWYSNHRDQPFKWG
jgi:ABC-type multidrug transport system ATPase subunit